MVWPPRSTGKLDRSPTGSPSPPLFIAPIAHFAAAAARGVESEEAAYEGGFAVAGACVTAIVPLILYRQNAIGGGDLKLLAALGALAQPSLGLELEMYGFLAAIVVAPARLAYDGKLFRTLKNSLYLMANPLLPKEKRRAVEPEAMTWFRLGPCIFIGVAVTTAFHWGSK